MRPASWWCKVEHCREWGRGGPKGAAAHLALKHRFGTGVSSTVSMGFTGRLVDTRRFSGDPGRPVWCENGRGHYEIQDRLDLHQGGPPITR